MNLAGGKVKEIFTKRTMALDGDDSVPKHTKIFMNWFMPEFYGEYAKKIGISRRSIDDKLLPGKGMHVFYYCLFLSFLYLLNRYITFKIF